MSSPYMTSAVRARMYDQAWQRWVTVVGIVVTFGLASPLVFFIAAKKGIVAWFVPFIYLLCAWGAPITASLVGNGKNWSGGVMLFAILAAAFHAAILDVEWKNGR